MCCFNSVHFSCSLFPSPAESKKVRNQCDPNQDHKYGLICCMLVPCQSSGRSNCTELSSACAQLSCSPRGPRNQNPRSNTTRERLFLNSQRWAQPSTGSQVTTRRLHNQTPSAVSVPLKIPWYKVQMFSWYGQTQSIMTFSEIGPGSLKCNAFDRCLSLQLHKSRYTE